MEYGGMAKCLICGKLFQHAKKFNIQRHYSVRHTNDYDKYGGEDRQVQVKQLKDKLLSEAREHTVSESMYNPHVAATRNLPNEIEHCIKQLPITFDCSERISSQKLRKALREDSFHQWSKLKSKGLGVVFYSHWKKGNSWISTKKGLSSSQWTQAIKMNCNTIPVRTLPGRTLDSTRCRRCDEQETLPHILGFCHHGELLRINRHNTVRSLIAASIRQNASYEVYEEVGCVSSDGSTRRADIIIIDRQKDKGYASKSTDMSLSHLSTPQAQKTSTLPSAPHRTTIDIRVASFEERRSITCFGPKYTQIPGMQFQNPHCSVYGSNQHLIQNIKYLIMLSLFKFEERNFED
ncbi:hypothetical protein ANN_02361 [Periplaneta americana]|uniref:C2H2-type domain-containing protein n=1 Tax=Periplaneta americana TaxID=6978 RepID=A0ABQ8TW24_PERAM|nr:hypothetical protein ANN_02361 [Periplaneta americana]